MRKMTDIIYAVIDTNVLVSSVLSDKDSPSMTVVRAIRDGEIRPVFSSHLLREYRRVLTRKELGINNRTVYELLNLFDTPAPFGVESIDQGSSSPDMKSDPIFDMVEATRDRGTYLVTGNTERFPSESYVLTPGQMVDKLDSAYVRHACAH